MGGPRRRESWAQDTRRLPGCEGTGPLAGELVPERGLYDPGLGASLSPMNIPTRRFRHLLLAAVLAGTAACAPRTRPPAPGAPTAGAPAPAPETEPAVLLVSLDGFRPDYLDPERTPNLWRLAAHGVRAEALIPSFPTKTFPNHYTIVTGLRPDHHGLVANNIWDPEMKATYGLSIRDEVQNPAWYGGTPVWVTAERAGIATAPLFWPGSEAPIGDVHPTYWKPYDGEMSHADRVNWVLDRMAGTSGPAARFATLYFSDTDDVGHRYGPHAPETAAAAARVDSAIGYLVDGLAARHLTEVNLVIVSDHGMSQLSRDRVIFLDDYIDPDATHVADWNPVLAIWPHADQADAIYQALSAASPHLKVYHRNEIPAHYQFGTNDRVAPIIAIADPGWSITTHDYYARNIESFDGGNHGYDQNSIDMRALFLADGPAFADGLVVAPFSNVDVYPLIMAVLGLPAAPNDGDLSEVSAMLETRTAGVR